jgi:hypothetical protein
MLTVMTHSEKKSLKLKKDYERLKWLVKMYERMFLEKHGIQEPAIDEDIKNICSEIESNYEN